MKSRLWHVLPPCLLLLVCRLVVVCCPRHLLHPIGATPPPVRTTAPLLLYFCWWGLSFGSLLANICHTYVSYETYGVQRDPSSIVGAAAASGPPRRPLRKVVRRFFPNIGFLCFRARGLSSGGTACLTLLAYRRVSSKVANHVAYVCIYIYIYMFIYVCVYI